MRVVLLAGYLALLIAACGAGELSMGDEGIVIPLVAAKASAMSSGENC
jgi:hypothetical protein